MQQVQTSTFVELSFYLVFVCGACLSFMHKHLSLLSNDVDCFRGVKTMLKISVQQSSWLVATMPSQRSWD